MIRKKKIKRIHVIIQVVCLFAIMTIIIFLYYGYQNAKLISHTSNMIQLKFQVKIYEDKHGKPGKNIESITSKMPPGFTRHINTKNIIYPVADDFLHNNEQLLFYEKTPLPSYL